MKQIYANHLYYKLLILLTGILCTLPSFAHGIDNNVVLTGIDGKRHAVSGYIKKGTWTLVNIWAVHCIPCREEIPELVRLHDKYHKNLISVIGIAIGFPEGGYPDTKEVFDFLKEYKVDYPILMANAKVTNELGAGNLQGLPTSLMYTPDSKLIAEQTGPLNQQIVLDFIKKYDKKHKIEKKYKKVMNKP